MKANEVKRNDRIHRVVCRAAALLCNLCMLAGGIAVLCGFGMSDTMTAPKAFCMLLSVGGAAAMVLGLRLRTLQNK